MKWILTLGRWFNALFCRMGLHEPGWDAKRRKWRCVYCDALLWGKDDE